MKILVRFDDICPTMDFKQFSKAVSIMDEFNIKPLIGVIPDCKDPDLDIDIYNLDFWNYVKSLQGKGYTIAMHGLNHIFDSPHKGIVNNRIGSEFAGHSLEYQIEKIRKGKEILLSHDIDTNIFFAPAHSYDLNTIKALAICGFKYMSDGKSRNPYKLYGINVIPCKSGGCPKIKNAPMYTAVFHAHEWTREDKKHGYDDLVNLIHNHKSNIVNFDEYVSGKIYNHLIQRCDEYLYVRYQRHVYPMLSNIYHKIRNK